MQMKLDEFKLRPNTHQTHIEDLVLLGKEGLEELNDKIQKTINAITNQSKEVNLTTKIDGAPAVTIWHHVDGYPDDSICLKSFVTSNKNCLSSVGAINDRYGGRADMERKLQYCLRLAQCIPYGEAWQGDCLFTDGDLNEVNIQGTDYLTFHPNKIIYAFSEDNPTYDKIKNSVFGICFHTIYKGQFGSLSQSFKVDPTRLSNVPSNYYILSPNINIGSKEDYSLNEITSEYEKLKNYESKLVSNPAYEELVNNSQFMQYWNTFENANLADKKQTNINVNTFIQDLKDYISDKLGKEYTNKLNTLKTDKGRQTAEDKYNRDLTNLSELIERNKGVLIDLVNTLNSAANVKMLLWAGFKKSKSDYNTFYKSKTKGYIHADPEGISVSDSQGNITKIVDRSTFSSFNRSDDIESGFLHNESLKEVNHININYWGTLKEDLNDKTVAFAFGRLNPPTIGHKKLVNTIAKQADDARLYLSHSQDNKKNPLSYEDKLDYCKRAFGKTVKVINSEARTVIEILNELYNEGVKNVIYVCGGDRATEMEALINKYNNVKTDKGYYNFDSINVINAGIRDEYSESPVERASASLARKYVVDNNSEAFLQIVPFNDYDGMRLFKQLRSILTGKDVESDNLEAEIKEEFGVTKLNEAPLGSADYPKHDYKYILGIIDILLSDDKELRLGTKGIEEGTFDKSRLSQKNIDALKELRNNIFGSTPDDFNKAVEGSGLKWTNIFKGQVSGYTNGPDSGNKGNAFEDQFIKNYGEFADEIKELTGYETLNSAPERTGGQNNVRPLTFHNGYVTCGATNDFNIGSTVSDVTLHTDKGDIYLSLKYGRSVTFVNSGVRKLFPPSYFEGENELTDDGKTLLKTLAIDEEKFKQVFNEYDPKARTTPKAHKDIVNVTNILKNSSRFNVFIKSVMGYGYLLVHAKGRNTEIIDLQTEADLNKFISELQYAEVQYPINGEAKRVDVLVVYPEIKFKINIRDKSGETKYPTHIMADYNFK